MKTKTKVIKEFLKSETWQHYYDNAPSQACKEYVKHHFTLCLYEGKEEKYIKEREEIEKRFSKRDWEYIYNNSRGQARENIKQRMKEWQHDCASET